MKKVIIFVLTVLLYQVLPAQDIKILTNHIGYDKNVHKRAIIQGVENDAVTSFRILDYNSGKEVMKGIPVKTGKVDKWKNWCFWVLDFDQLTDEGTYTIECIANNKKVVSFPFIIQNNILERNTLSDVVFYFKGQRCSGLLDKADKNSGFEGKEGKVNVSGGWYDASGDYGKHLSHLSFSTYFNPQQISLTAWGLFKTYQALERRNDPNFKQYKRRVLDEALYGADYLVRIKNPTGSFYLSVSGGGPEKKPEDRKISKESQGYTIQAKDANGIPVRPETKSLEVSAPYEAGFRAGGGLSIAALALASTYDVSGDFSKADYLKTAEDAFATLEKNNILYTNDGKENIVDDYCALIAAVELYKATKNPIYKPAADFRAKNLMNRMISNGKYKNYWRADDKDRPFFHAADAGLPLVSLISYLDVTDEATKKLVLQIVKKSLNFELSITEEVANPFGYARQYVQNIKGERRSAFFYPHDTETAPWWQGENARLGSLAAAARMAASYFKDDKPFHEKLQNYAWDQLSWILGLNPYDCCMLYGSGRNNIDYLFFNSYEYANAPGGISNGITGGYSDPDDIDFDMGYAKTGKDDDWRWAEQWLPHASWYMIAVAVKE
jgi:hypothetical protein